jgi:hypothetical protein
LKPLPAFAHEIANLVDFQNYISPSRQEDGRQTMREELAIISGELERIGKMADS